MAAGIKDIAKYAGCSEATVSLALNGSGAVNEETKNRILKIAEGIGYIPNLSARKLARRKSGCLGLIIPDIENVFYASLVKHINAAARAGGYTLIIAVSENSPDAEREIVASMIENRVEGVVVVPMNQAHPHPNDLTILHRYHIPYVFCSDYYESLSDTASVVMSDLEGGMYALTREVLRAGYQSPVYLTGDDAVASLRLRKCGFERAMAEIGISPLLSRLQKLDDRAAHDAVGEILQDHPETDALICVNDMIAVGAVNALSALHCRIPEIGVTGFDDVIFSKIAFPPITTMAQNIKEMAQKSVALLLGKQHQKEDILLPTTMIRRASLKPLTKETDAASIGQNHEF